MFFTAPSRIFIGSYRFDYSGVQSAAVRCTRCLVSRVYSETRSTTATNKTRVRRKQHSHPLTPNTPPDYGKSSSHPRWLSCEEIRKMHRARRQSVLGRDERVSFLRQRGRVLNMLAPLTNRLWDCPRPAFQSPNLQQ